MTKLTTAQKTMLQNFASGGTCHFAGASGTQQRVLTTLRDRGLLTLEMRRVGCFLVRITEAGEVALDPNAR